jgi:hypothetical protein
MLPTVSLVVDESLAGVELAAGLAVDQEHIRALNGGTASGVGDHTKWLLVGKELAVETGNEPQLTDRGFWTVSRASEALSED